MYLYVTQISHQSIESNLKIWLEPKRVSQHINTAFYTSLVLRYFSIKNAIDCIPYPSHSPTFVHIGRHINMKPKFFYRKYTYIVWQWEKNISFGILPITKTLSGNLSVVRRKDVVEPFRASDNCKDASRVNMPLGPTLLSRVLLITLRYYIKNYLVLPLWISLSIPIDLPSRHSNTIRTFSFLPFVQRKNAVSEYSLFGIKADIFVVRKSNFGLR